MLPKTQRISTNRFGEIVNSGKNLNFGAFYIKTLPNDITRFAVAVPKKVVKGAIKRHFMKRRLFMAIKNHINLFPAKDYIVFVNKEAEKMTFEEIDQKIKDIAQKVASLS